jgi:tRNA threonylcarbamoyladenosine biosynthesis protein TsaE
VRSGDFIALSGDLGAGNTCFVRGVAVGLAVNPATVTSPTYALLHSYSGRLPLHHFDLYRLAGDDDVTELGFDEYFYGNGVCLVEWADRLTGEFPLECLAVTFSHLGGDARRLEFAASGGRYEELVKNLFPDR